MTNLYSFIQNSLIQNLLIMRLYILSLMLLIAVQMRATEPFVISVTPEWEATPHTQEVFPDKRVEILRFKGADYATKHPTLPSIVEVFPLSSGGQLKVTLKNAQYERTSKQAHKDDIFIKKQIDIQTHVGIDRGKAVGSITFVPLRQTASGQLERLVSAELHVRHTPTSTTTFKNNTNNTTVSVLSSGELYKIAVSEAGVYKIDASFLSDELNINTNNIDPRRIQLFGNGGGMLAEIVGDFRHDDVYENAIHVSGQADGSFDSGDFILFYAEGPHHTNYDEASGTLRNTKNLYSDESYYFLKIDGENGKRIGSQASLNDATYSSDSYDALIHFEEEKVNLLDYFSATHPGGRQWFGDHFKYVNEQEYDFNFNHLKTDEPVKVRTNLIGRSVDGGTHRFALSHNGSQIANINMGSTGGGGINTFAAIKTAIGTLNATGDDIKLKLDYTRPTGAEGWLDYIALQARCDLKYSDKALIFKDLRSIGESVSNFTVSSANSNVQLWDVTSPLDPKIQNYDLNSNQLTFGANTETLKTFTIFEHNNLAKPNFIEKIAPQNLHGITTPPDMLLIYAPELESAVTRFVNHRSEHNNITIETVPVQQIFNEFGSGAPDITAIRDFVKMLYTRSTPAQSIKYLLMFGDGSFDFKNNNEKTDYSNHVPLYETIESLDPIRTYPADDYFVLLDDEEGRINTGYMDVAVGRFPVQNLAEAEAVVDKIIRYDVSPQCFGDWRNRLVFNADDEDGNLHFRDADVVASKLDDTYDILNVNKIYFDAYQQVSTPGGNRYPKANEAINNNMFRGNLVMNYTGHGGSNGWAQEFVLRMDDINSWTNANKLPLIVTATCEFAPYDDDGNATAGERIFLNPNGGGIALFTTVRAVYASANYRLSDAVFKHLFEPVNGEIPAIGEILRLAKNSLNGNIENSRKFALLGDPSLKLSRPKYQIATTKINDQIVSGTDTVKALEEVTIEGIIQDENGNILNDFNGILYPTVFDKTQTVKTIGNDEEGSSPAPFDLQNNVIFKGRASVTNGQFKFSFVVPSDINFSFGAGKISYYADDGVSRDAAGHYENLIIGGTSDGATDDQPPVVEVYMNNENFVFGDVTDTNPTLLVKLSDDLGINTAGTSIGHDLTGVVDDNTQKTYIFNDFYESALDNPREGKVEYPLSEIPEGRHTVKVKAWDVSNNSAEGYTEFVVARNAEIALSQVLNYPNPFTTHTSFQFEHNFAGQTLDVMVQILTTSGQLVKTINETVQTDGYRVTGIQWDGTDDFGERIGRGVYVYRISIQSDTGEQSKITKSKFEKLVILK